MMCDFKQSTERVGLKIHPDKTKILCNQSSNRRKEMEINNIEVEILFCVREYEISWTKNYVSATGNSSDQKTNQSGLGFVLQIQTRADVKIVNLTSQTTLIQHGDHASAELRFWHLDTIKGTRKNDTIDSTKDASPRRPNRKKIQK